MGNLLYGLAKEVFPFSCEFILQFKNIIQSFLMKDIINFQASWLS